MLGTIIWYNKIKKRGYILGLDNEKYFFDYLCQVDSSEIFSENDQVLFIPFFEYDLPYASQVEKNKD